MQCPLGFSTPATAGLIGKRALRRLTLMCCEYLCWGCLRAPVETLVRVQIIRIRCLAEPPPVGPTALVGRRTVTISRVKFPWPPFFRIFIFFDEILISVCGTTYLMRDDGATVVNVRP